MTSLETDSMCPGVYRPLCLPQPHQCQAHRQQRALTSVSTSALDLSLTEVGGFLDVFRFLLQGLARPFRLSNFLF
jgi:hypothetical protein